MHTTSTALLMFLLVVATEPRVHSQTTSAPARAARIFGQVLRADGKSAGGARVSAITPRRSLHSVPVSVGHELPEASEVEELSAEADAEGRFRIEVEEFGCYGLVAERGSEASVLVFPVFTGDPVTLRLEAVRTVTGNVVVERDGGEPAPVAGAQVEAALTGPSSHGYNWSGLRWPKWIRRVRSGPDGGFSVTIPDSVTATLTAALDGTVSAPLHSAPRETGPTVLTITPEQSVQGLVVDAATREPVAGARVGWRTEGARTVLTDAKGRFSLGPIRTGSEVLVRSGTHRLAALRPTSEEYAGKAELQFELVPGLTLEARLLREDGTPLTGARLLFATNYEVPSRTRDGGSASGLASWPDRVGEQGVVRVGWLRPDVPVSGFVEVDGIWIRFVSERPNADVKLGDVRLSVAGKIEGTVLAPDGSPVAAATVRLLPDTARAGGVLSSIMGNQYVGTLTNRAGKFRFPGLAPGRYRVGAMAAGHGYVFADTVVPSASRPAGNEIRSAPPLVELRLPAGESLGGKLVDADGLPIPDATILLRPMKRDTEAALFWFHNFWCSSDPAGRFLFRGLADDSFHLMAHVTRKGVRLSGQIQSITPGEADVVVELGESR